MIPLAELLRPKNLSEIVGQQHLLGANGILRKMIESDQISSLIFWGPPGTGKTTLAKIIANSTNSNFVAISAVSSGVKEIREVVKTAELDKKETAKATIIFIDEIHRYNKGQQDALLPHVEAGTITLIGATTENPSFELNSALLSRIRVLKLNSLKDDEIKSIIERALDSENNTKKINLEDDAKKIIIKISSGDARSTLNILEALFQYFVDKKTLSIISAKELEEIIQKKVFIFDKAGEEHYNIISALHKSLRNSDPDAALYWLARMIEAGEDPLYIVRRLIRFASEDIGNADPQALILSIAAKETVHFVGMPEANNALAQLVIYLATAPKSNSVYLAYNKVKAEVENNQDYPVPLNLRNAVTKLGKSFGFGSGYKYAHDEIEGVANMQCLPDELKGRKFYEPIERGFEREIKKRLEYWEKLRRN